MSRIKKIKEIRKSPLFLIVGLFLCLWCFTLRVNAAEPTIYQVDQMTDEDTIINGDSVITGKGTSGKHSFYVEEKVKTTITLRNLDVHLDSALLEIGERADVTLILEGENNLQRDVGSIITLQKHSSLTIKGGGSLNVKTKTDSQDVGGAVPAIGGRDGFNHITIESGSISVVVEAVSRSEYDTTYHHPGVAIGRGNHATEGKIYINGGTIYAQTQGDAAIGGSGSGSAEDIIISGGDITAIGGMETAAIGFGTYNAGQRSSYTLRLDPQKVAKMRVAGRAEEEVNFENTQKELTISGSRRSKFRLKDGEFDRVSIFDYQKGLQVVSGGAYTYENGVLTLNGSGSYNVKMADQTRYTSDRIVVNNASELTLTDVQMEAFKGNSNLTFNKDATLILEGTNRLRSEDGSAVFTDHNLSVKGSGKLEAGVRLENKPLEEQSGIFGGSGTVSLNCKEVSLDDTISFGDDSDDSEDLDDLEDLEDLEYLKKKILLSGFKMWDTRGAYQKRMGLLR